MTPKEHRAFARGYRFALRKARKELDEMARRLAFDIQAIFRRRRHQARRPPPAKIRPGQAKAC